MRCDLRRRGAARDAREEAPMLATSFDALLRRDLDFQLYDMQKMGELVERERFREHDVDTFDSVIDTAYDIAGERFAPIAAELDANEPHASGNDVTTAPSLGPALKAFIDAGFMGVVYDESLGGMQMPHMMMGRDAVDLQRRERAGRGLSVPHAGRGESARRLRERRAAQDLARADGGRALLRDDGAHGDTGGLVARGSRDARRTAG